MDGGEKGGAFLGLLWASPRRVQVQWNVCGHGRQRPILSMQLQVVLQSPLPEFLCELGESLGSFMWLQKTLIFPSRAPGPKILLGPRGSRKLTPISWSIGLGL